MATIRKKTNRVADCLEYFHLSPKKARIGIPQGGAHSCFIANLILDFADKQVGSILSSSNAKSLYLRYCDDIIIISASSQVCRKASAVYKRSLEKLKLPFHQPAQLTGQLRQFYNDSKTKECYKWGSLRSDSEFPWIQFLGYQIKFSGEIRIRPSSIAKQKDKIDSLRSEICNRIKHSETKVSARRVLYRFNSKVWAFSSGRINISDPKSGPLPMCWASGFRQLAKRPFSPSHVRKLDRAVGLSRRRLARFLKKSQTGEPANTENKRALKFFGGPFSHLRQFIS